MKSRTVGVIHEPVDEDDLDAAAPVPASAAPLVRIDSGVVASPGDDDDVDEDVEEHVSLGDRLRKALASSGDKEPLYPRVLMLKNVHPNGWQRAMLVEGMALVGGLVALADRATAWAPVILPIGAAAVVKFHDVLAGLLPKRDS